MNHTSHPLGNPSTHVKPTVQAIAVTVAGWRIDSPSPCPYLSL
jgi:hypothetical protein